MRSAAMLAAAMAFGIAAQLLFFAQAPGLNVAVGVALFLGLLSLVRGPARRVDPADLWLPVGALLLASFAAIRADAPLLLSNALGAAGLSAATAVSFTGLRISRLPVGEAIVAGARAGGSLLRSGASLLRPAARAIAPVVGPRAGGYLIGVALAAPLVVVFAALFSSADAIFAKSLDDLATLFSPQLLRELPGRIVLASAATWIAGGAFVSTRPSTAGAPSIRSRLAAEPAVAMLAMLDALFAAFVALQLVYLFGGSDTVAASGLSYSAYARRGFFELMAVTGLVGMFLFAFELQLRARRPIHLLLELGLLALSAIVLLSAWYRLDLYQRAYGWSELRAYALAGIAFCALALAIIAWCILTRRMRHVLQPLAVAAIATLLALDVVGPTALVVRANVARAAGAVDLPPDAERALDACYLVGLGDGAIPTLVALLPTLPEGPDRDRSIACLRSAARHRSAGPTPWQSWNSDRAAADAALGGLFTR